MGKKGRKGTKKIQGAKAKSVLKVKREAKHLMKASSKAKKPKSKAMKTKLKEMYFNKDKKIEEINANINKVLLAPAKLKIDPSTSTERKPTKDLDGDSDMPDVPGLSNMMSSI